MHKQAKIDDPHLLEEMYAHAERSTWAITVQSGAQELKVAWATARGLLRTLVSQDRLEAIQTANGWVFRPKQAQTVPRVDSVPDLQHPRSSQLNYSLLGPSQRTTKNKVQKRDVDRRKWVGEDLTHSHPKEIRPSRETKTEVLQWKNT